jgi:hypothetical protein
VCWCGRVASLGDGRILLFLEKLQEVGVWRWPDGAQFPELMRRVSKRFLEGHACPRLPSTLPESAIVTYKSLRRHVNGLEDAERAELARLHVSILEITIAEAATRWLVAQRFDAAYTTQAANCNAVPVCSLAVPLSGTPVRGAVFCFLPVGDIVTGFPMHVNGKTKS